MIVKVCGNKYKENITEVLTSKPDMLGFIFYGSSPRNVDKTLSPSDLETIPQYVVKTGVFVNEEISSICKTVRYYQLDMVQLHGYETPEFCKLLSDKGIKVIKSFHIDDMFDFAFTDKYSECAKYFLFDTRGNNYGGNGKKFDWGILNRYSGKVPFLLSGGITPEDHAEIKKIKHKMFAGIDLNSGFEDKPGIKDTGKIIHFLQEIKYSRMENRYSINDKGFYGEFGGAFIPEMLQRNIDELTECYHGILDDERFKKEFFTLLNDYAGRPSPLYFAPRLSARYGTRVFLKREDLNHTGSHKINNALGQVLLAERMGKKRIIAETGAGQHGVATATVCALKGLECIVYMGAVDVKRQAPNVERMRMLGATVVPVTNGNMTLKDATSEAIRDWIAHPLDTHYIIGSVVGPHPYPEMVTYFQSVISEEIQQQLVVKTGRDYPDAVIACVGGGSNAAGAFYKFIDNPEVKLYGAEGAGKGEDTPETAATMATGTTGILHGSRILLMQDDYGQITEPYSISAGLDYPGVGPLHAHLHKTGRATYIPVKDNEALEAAYTTTRLEGIIPALESAHAIAVLEKVKFNADQIVVVNLSGRGDKDMDTYIGRLKAKG